MGAWKSRGSGSGFCVRPFKRKGEIQWKKKARGKRKDKNKIVKGPNKREEARAAGCLRGSVRDARGGATVAPWTLGEGW